MPRGQNAHQLDVIGGALYGTVPDQALQSMIQNSAERMANAVGSNEPLRIAQIAQTAGRTAQVAAFFALLNYDTELKTRLRDLGEARAEGFYNGVRHRAIPKWLENEARNPHDLVEDLRFEYRNA